MSICLLNHCWLLYNYIFNLKISDYKQNYLFLSQLKKWNGWMQNLIFISNNVFASAGRDRLYLLLQDSHECPGLAGTVGQPVAHWQQHHRLPPPPHPLGPLLSAGPARAAPSHAPPSQPPQRAAPASTQVVQPERAPTTLLIPPFKHCPPSPALYRTLFSLPNMLNSNPYPPKAKTHLPNRSEVFAPLLLLLCFGTL